MEDIVWKKDETPYVVFPCNKCRQYIYAKTTQKSKKCTQCGSSHVVSTIVESGEIVYGISRRLNYNSLYHPILLELL